MSTLRALLLAAASAALSGCGPDSYNPGPETCDRSEEHNPAILYTDGTVEGGVYMSSGWDGELLYFPGGMHYKIEHYLEDVPRYFAGYLSFDRFGTRDGGTVAMASGNQVELLRADDRFMVLRNAECVDYWLIVVAGTATPPSP